MGLVIKDCTIAELEAAPNIHALLDEYAAESSPSIKGLPRPLAKADTYKHLENAGAINVIGAWLDNFLIGYIITVAPIMPHYSVRMAVSESFFVLKEYRKTGAGLKLLHAAEDWAKDSGALGILVSSPTGGDLANVLPRIGYTETNRVFFRSLGDE